MLIFRRMLVLFAAVALVNPAAAETSPAYKFLKAVLEHNIVAAKAAIEEGGPAVFNLRDPDTGETALHIVTRRGNLGWITFMLDAGANPDVRDGEGATPLLIAATYGSSDVVRILLSHRAMVDLPNSLGQTPLLKAVQMHDLPSMRILVANGANPDHADNAGISPRSYAKADVRSETLRKVLEETPASSQRPSL